MPVGTGRYSRLAVTSRIPGGCGVNGRVRQRTTRRRTMSLDPVRDSLDGQDVAGRLVLVQETGRGAIPRPTPRRNLPGELKTILANCLAHGRRQFVDVAEHFPEECRHLLEALTASYRNDAIARSR